jgi:hypothetical protein
MVTAPRRKGGLWWLEGRDGEIHMAWNPMPPTASMLQCFLVAFSQGIFPSYEGRCCATKLDTWLLGVLIHVWHCMFGKLPCLTNFDSSYRCNVLTCTHLNGFFMLFAVYGAYGPIRLLRKVHTHPAQVTVMISVVMDVRIWCIRSVYCYLI